MTITRAEWLRSLPGAVGDHALSIDDDTARVRVCTDGAGERRGEVVIRWNRADDLMLGLIRLQRLRVTFDLTALSPGTRADFMRRFDLHMQRGGG